MILMTRDNPTGHKLECLLMELREEIEAKTLKISGDTSEVAARIRENNEGIVQHLAKAEQLQRDTLAMLLTIAPDSGPTGTPRIG